MKGGGALGSAVFRSNTLSGDKSKRLDGATAVIADAIQSLTTTGFTIGASATVNTLNECYQVLAVKDSNNTTFICTTYVGNGLDDRTLTGAGFAPDWAVVFQESTQNAVWRGVNHAAGMSQAFSAGVLANMIQAFTADGIQVGTHARVNADTVTYHVIYGKEKANVFSIIGYVGNAGDNRSIGGIGLTPDFVGVQAEDTQDVFTFKTKDMIGDTALNISAGAEVADKIQAIESDGFQIGTHSSVNSVDNYVAICFKIT